MLIELSKVHAPSLLLQDFNYLFNKAISQYINKRYNIYDVSQQTTDDLRVLKSTTVLTPTLAYKNNYTSETNVGKLHPSIANLQGATYEVILPKDYLHLLNCICVYKVNKNFKCYDKGTYVQFAATRLTADLWSNIINDFYRRPLPERPYFYLHNVNKQVNLPTNIYDGKTGTDQVTNTIEVYKISTIQEYATGTRENAKTILNLQKDSLIYDALKKSNISYTGNVTDQKPIVSSNGHMYFLLNNTKYYIWYDINTDTISFKTSSENPWFGGAGSENSWLPITAVKGSISAEFPRETTLRSSQTADSQDVSLIEKPANLRHSNQSDVRLEIRYGKDTSVFELVEVVIDYIKSPQYIRLTQEQLDLTEDTSQIMEFPDYVCQEIINELVTIVMENNNDPRLQTHVAVSQSIASPTQQQTTQQ